MYVVNDSARALLYLAERKHSGLCAIGYGTAAYGWCCYLDWQVEVGGVTHRLGYSSTGPHLSLSVHYPLSRSFLWSSLVPGVW